MPRNLVSLCERTIEAGWLVAAAVVPLYFNIYSNRVFEPDKLTLLRLIALVMALAWAVRGLETASAAKGAQSLRRFLTAAPLTIPVLLYSALYLLTTLTSVWPHTSLWGSYHRLQGTLSYLSYIVIFLLAAHHLRQEAQLRRLVNVALLTSLPIALYAVIQHLGLDPIPWGADVSQRVTSTMGNAIFLGAYLIMVIPLTLSRLTTVLVPWLRGKGGVGGGVVAAAHAMLLVIQLLALLFTQSRGPWLGLGLGLALWGGLFALARRRRRLALGVAAMALAGVTFVIVLNLPQSPLAPLKGTSVYLERLGSALDMEAPTNKVRLLIWFGDEVGKGALGMVTADPLRTLVGYGPESMFVAFNPFYPPRLTAYESRGAVPDRAHNDLLDQLVTTGLLGLLSYLLVVFVFFRSALRQLFASGDLPRQALLVGLIAAVAAHLGETFFGIAIAATRSYFWLYLGVVMALPSVPGLAQGRPLPRRRGGQRARAGADRPNPLSWLTNPRVYPLLFYLAVTAVVASALLRPEVTRAIQGNPPLYIVLSFLWLLFAIAFTALAIGGPWSHRGSPAQATTTSAPSPARRWLYLPLLAGAAYLAYLLLSMVIADVYFKVGIGYVWRGELAKSIASYQEAARWGDGEDIYFSFLGGAYIQLGERSPSGADRPDIDSVADLFTPEWRQPQGRGREELFRAGELALVEAKANNPLNPDNSSNLGRLYALWAQVSADPESRQQRFRAAHEQFAAAAKLRPNAAHLFAEWGRIYALEERFDEARQRLEQALRLEGDYPPALVTLAQTMEAQGQEAAAVGTYQQAAEAFLARRQPKRAIEMYRRALALASEEERPALSTRLKELEEGNQ